MDAPANRGRERRYARRFALRNTVVYLLAATLWIFASDRFAQHFAGSVLDLTLIQTAKGWLFVLATSAALYVLVYRGVRDSLQAQHLHRLAHFDELTGLPNPVLFTPRLEHAIELARVNRQTLAVVRIDLEGLKFINDSLGTACGDKVLVDASRCMAERLRAGDTLARREGNKFVVLMEKVADSDLVAGMAERLRACLTEGFEFQGEKVHLSAANVGISLYPQDGDSARALLSAADAALHRAKAAGQPSLQFYTPDLNRQAYRRFRLLNDLRAAIDNGALSLAYQPQVSIDDGRIIGVEALARWEHPDLGWVSPEEFIGIAESGGLIDALGQWALETACRQAARWIEQAVGEFRVAVNLSGLQLHEEDLAAQVAGALERSALPPRLLELEITESTAMVDPEATRRVLARLKELGVSISIDDFGTGYSSLAQLKRLPVDRLKIDRAFITGIPKDRENDGIVRAILSMARTMDMEVVAEGVETASELACLTEYGCDIAQGYLIARPLTAEACSALLKEDCQSNRPWTSRTG
ncbi:MAG: bifunctional diguanylate cyclase/phosphodiesterase [Gammaproteobacteria bacterium]|jgi:diguanylate cyclase (GGDEF)-like protein